MSPDSFGGSRIVGRRVMRRDYGFVGREMSHGGLGSVPSRDALCLTKVNFLLTYPRRRPIRSDLFPQSFGALRFTNPENGMLETLKFFLRIQRCPHLESRIFTKL